MEKVQLSQINIETKDNCAMYYTDDGIIIENNDNECKSFSLFTTQSPDLPVAFLNVSFVGGCLETLVAI